MMLDTSVIVSILNQEADAGGFAEAIERASRVSVSAGTVLEASIVLGRARGEGLDGLLRVASVTVVPVDARHAQAARVAWDRYGRAVDPRRGRTMATASPTPPPTASKPVISAQRRAGA